MVELITIISIIVTIIGAFIGVYTIFIDKRKKKKEKEETDAYLNNREVIPLINWAKQKNIEKDFLLLIKRLISFSQNIEVHDVETFDLIVKSEKQDKYIPNGNSCWELNTSFPENISLELIKNCIKSNISENSQDNTFVFVSPFLIDNKENLTKKIDKGNWKEIKIYDAKDITDWLQTEPAISIWFEIKYLDNTFEGVVFPDEYWEEWSTGTNFNLNASLILGGRENETAQIIKTIQTPSIIAIQSSSREESLAFTLSCFINQFSEKDKLLSKCFIIDSPSSFRKLIEKNDQLILIPRFEESEIINLALKKGHTVIIPIGLDNTINWELKIVLPPLDRDKFVNSLIESGFDKNQSEKLSIESARNITILRRQLKLSRTIPQWASSENVKDIIPALIAGRWSDSSKDDRELISKLSGVDYEEYIFKLKKWLLTSDSPIVKIDNFWRLTSPLDAWTNASHFLINSDFEKLGDAFLKVLSEKNPSFEVPAKERMFMTKNGEVFSSWIKEGLTQSLILVAVYGDKLKVDLPVSSQIWVDRLVTELLSNENELIWKSFERLLPQLAEASPNAFLETIEKHLKSENSVVFSLFKEEEGFITPASYHTGLLWGLENIAWTREYFSRASIILAKLAVIDPGGNLSNRPKNSLIEIFKPWHFQTLASYNDRMEVLSLICKEEPEIAWALLCSMLPDNHSVGMPTHKMRWRLFDEKLEKPITYDEIWKTHSRVVELLISIFDDSEEKLSKLIEESSNKTLSPKDRKMMVDFLDSRLENVKQSSFVAWSKLREILSRHRSHSDTDWALPEEDLKKYEEFYARLTPKDEINQTLWLFDDHHPNLPQGFKYPEVPFEKQSQVIDETRTEALRKLYLKVGIEKIIELKSRIKQPWIYGDVLARFLDEDEAILKVCEELKLEMKELGFVQSFFNRKYYLKGIDWIFKIFNNLKQLSFDNASLANLLLSIEQNQILWDKLEAFDSEIKNHYWLNIYPRFFGMPTEQLEYGLKKLIDYKRYYSAIDASSHNVDKITPELLVLVLDKAATDEASEEVRIDGYEINRIFETLDKHDNINRDTLIKLEWFYLPLLASYGNRRNPKILHEELANSTDFFIDILKILYKSENELIAEKESNEVDESQAQNRARQAYELLNGWKTIPGVDEQNNINKEVLTSWIQDVRKKADECGRLEVADMHIGKILAQYPEESENWPPEVIGEIIEHINTESLKNNFSSALFNKRGSSTRGAFDGGDIERGHAKYFEKLAENNKNKFPRVSAIFSRLAKGYYEDAKRMDNRAKIDRLNY
jgi:hypothetical protein